MPAAEEVFGTDSPARAHFVFRRRVLLFQRAVDLLRTQFELRVRRLRARLKQEARGVRQLELQARSPDKRNRLDNVRADLSEGFAKLLDALEESVKRSLLPDSAMLQRIDNAVEGLSPQDLEHEKTAVSIQLSVSEAFQSEMADVIKEMLKENFTSDARILKKSLQELQLRTQRQLLDAMGVPAPLTLRAPDPAPAWNHLRQMIKVEVRYRGEMPKRGIFKRIMEARSVVTILLMMFSMVGGVIGMNPRQLPIFGALLLLVFLGFFIFTFRSWKREDEVRISRELERVRDQLKMELRRLLGDLQREKIARFASHLDELKREVSRRLDTLNKEMLEGQVREIERERRDASGRMRALETTIREFDALRGAFPGLSKSVAELEQTLVAPSPSNALQTAQ